MEKFIYYPGCIGESCSKHFDRVTRIVMQKLGLEFEYCPEMSCCGSVNLKEKDEFANLIINGRNFAIAEALGMNIVTICNTCLYTMSDANKKLIENPLLRHKVNLILKDFNLHYSGGVRVKHLLWHLLEDYGADNLKKDVKIDLGDLKVAPFYGCHIMRPKKILSFDHNFKNNDFDEFIKIVGAKLVNKEAGEMCCGFHVQKINEKETHSMVEHITAGIDNAHAIVTPCTECGYALDAFAKKSRKPVLFFTQLLGLGLGLGEKELELNRHFIPTKDIINIVRGRGGPIAVEDKKTLSQKIKEQKEELAAKTKPEKKKQELPLEAMPAAPRPNTPPASGMKLDKKFDMEKARQNIMK